MIPAPGPARDAHLAEYVIGTLGAADSQEVEHAAARDPALADSIAALEYQFHPLTALAPPVQPPAGTWEAILARITPMPAAAPALAARASAGWQKLFGAGVAGAAVAGLAAFLVLRPAPPPDRYVGVMQTDQQSPAWVVEADRQGGIRLAAFNRGAVPEGRVMQLWGLAPGDAGPTSLGLLPPDGTRFQIDTSRRPPVDDMLVEISLEPPGGSPIGRPTGPVVFIGRLQRVE